jgi:hypothetical protein
MDSFKKKKKDKPQQVVSLTITCITIVSCIHLRDISKTTYNYTINQYEFTNLKKKKEDKKLVNREQTACPSPSFHILHH